MRPRRDGGHSRPASAEGYILYMLLHIIICVITFDLYPSCMHHFSNCYKDETTTVVSKAPHGLNLRDSGLVEAVREFQCCMKVG
jgi:hypothetical protein